MSTRYELVNPNEIPPDSVVVTVREVHGRPMGDVACARCSAAEEYAVADFPRPILVALERAEELRDICNLARVVISLAPGTRWNPAWGELAGRGRPAGGRDGAHVRRHPRAGHSPQSAGQRLGF